MTKTAPIHKCELYLRIALTGTASSAIDRIAPLLARGDIACLLIAPPPATDDPDTASDDTTDSAIDPTAALALCEAAKEHDLTVLIEDDAQLARIIKAHGVHLTWHDDIVKRFDDAREILDGQAIVGADAGRSRHIAMCLGERNAEYVAFGIPAHVGDVEKARSRQLGLFEWWSEIFEIPSVAFNVPNNDQARTLAASGADFIVFDMPNGLSGAALLEWFEACVDATATPRTLEPIPADQDARNA